MMQARIHWMQVRQMLDRETNLDRMNCKEITLADAISGLELLDPVQEWSEEPTKEMLWQKERQFKNK